ncbi:phosphoadenosine phosphosulfate reductase [Luteitalea sp. TBR-22]|uniref:phosphoadenylyl-sulfate reductase n=1 Tax=Luteitalea sp. TBR-22 TaxID=2802971 RepID=UPI001AF5CC0D|nr:phosphoadenylyl-sulfate reductase [Luteitalea sp. TBR-22]BCS32483.1 phosphoadenosine phosphosulfate reductase [Luteitalea sp. TBR-22]
MATHHDTHDLHALASALEALDLPGRLRLVADRFPGTVAFSTSLGQEDQVITDAIWTHDIPIRIFTLDTGRLFEETHALIDATRERYGRQIEVYFPDAAEVEVFVGTRGHHSFRASVDDRKACCELRKVRPLARALQGVRVWVTGLRREQSANRQGMRIVEWDEGYGLLKLNPLIEWSLDEVVAYLDEHDVPDNPLHAQGYVSIGCAPCTRPIAPGEDPRAGRWWWEASKKECGLHRVLTPVAARDAQEQS